jgi:hypothetical protein
MNAFAKGTQISPARICARFKSSVVTEVILRNTLIEFSKWKLNTKEPTMNRVSIFRSLFVLLGTICFVLPVAAGQSSARTAAAPVTITGQVSCSKFVGPVIPRKGFTVAETIHLCISQGYTYTIVAGKNIYPLVGDKNQLAKLAGETVTVSGHLNPDRSIGATYALMDTVEADTVAPTKN